MINILAVSGSGGLRREIRHALSEHGYVVSEAENRQDALENIARASVQLIVADYDADGCELTADLRQGGDATPVIILLPGAGVRDRRRVFRSGADGYMPLPLDGEELSMRVENLLWRCNIVADAVLRIGSCELRSSTYQLATPAGNIDLRRMEFLLLQKLLSYPGRIFTRPQLMDELWGYDSRSDPRTVDTHIKLLRRKLKNIEDIRIQTVRGLGYRAVIKQKARQN